jgi:hypothetical protein
MGFLKQKLCHFSENSTARLYTEKKLNKIFLIYREIQSGAVAKSYMWKGFLIHL